MSSHASAACPICHRTTTEVYRCHICVHEPQFDRYTGGDGTHGQESEPFYHCKSCGFVFRIGTLPESVLASYTHRPLSEDEILASIKAHYQDRMTSGKLGRLDWLETNCKFNRILDVGAGSGELVKILSDRGYQATGIDPDKDRIRLANQCFGLDMQTGFYTDIAYGASQFDLIVCECVLYRFPNPDVFFRAAWKHLEPGGHVFLVLPDVHLVQLNFLTNSVRCLYSPEAIEPLVASRGFRCVSLLQHGEAPVALRPGNFAVLAQKVEPSTLQWRFTGRPDRDTAYKALLKQDYGLVRSRAVSSGLVALLRLLDDANLYTLGRTYSRGITLADKILSSFAERQGASV